MQGRTLRDASGANVRVIDLIPGKTLYDAIRDLAMPRAAYVATVLPGLLTGLRDAIEGIALLHAHGLCHGDIRNDHLLVEAGTGRLRWIDFDLAQAFSDFDVWSLGNVLSFVAGQGMLTFHEVRASTEIPAAVKASLTAADASAFFPYRVMNLRKVYPDLPDALGEILLHFTADTRAYYESVRPMIDDLDRALATWPGRTDG
jgi:serine/threonine protein kinase